jgi:hypothetical protein
VTLLEEMSQLDEIDVGEYEIAGVIKQEERAGYGRCGSCSCAAYQDSLSGNSYCNCGHSYESHY